MSESTSEPSSSSIGTDLEPLRAGAVDGVVDADGAIGA